MDILPSDKHTKERKIAEAIANKLKNTAATLESNDPAHKNGVKYIISKKVYENIVPLKPEDIAETIYWMASRPAHVNINDILIMPTIQANSTTVLR